MPAQKKQHYVPQCILRNFTNDHNKFYLFQVLKNRIIDQAVPYKDHCYTDYLYGKDGTWENWLAKHEKEIAPIFHLILDGAPLSIEQKNSVKRFILVQHMRTEKAIDRNCNIMSDIYTKIIPMVAKKEGIKISPLEVKKFADHQVKNYDRSEIAIEDMTFVEENFSHFDDLRLVILHSKSEVFICSDHPVSISNLSYKHGGIGVDCAGLIVTMPISPEYCLMLIDDGVYDYEDEQWQIELDVFDVKKLNYRQFVQCREIMFSVNKNTLENVKTHFESLYIDNPLREWCIQLGLSDPIIINRKVIEIKNTYRSAIEKMIPKLYAQDDFNGLSKLSLKPEFRPYGDDINSMFDRFGDSNDIPDKYRLVGSEYPDLIKRYYINRGR